MPNIDVPHKFEKFYRHLNLDPTRVLFSGPFGSGKTTFINSFLKEYSNEYAAITVFPVNYSVASNNDIFDLIKYDIIFELLKTQQIDLEQYYYFSDDSIQHILKSSVMLTGLFTSIVENTADIGKVLQLGSKASDEAIKNFKRFLKNIIKDEGQDLFEFIKDRESVAGIYENSHIISLIEELVHRYTNNGDKKSILVIDDLDRLDPEHIFRLLNIFSSYHDDRTDYHKLGFDIVLISCDVKNISSIFYHKYGNQADFNGYINKFYTHEIYHFDLIDGIMDNLDTIIQEFKSEGSQLLKIQHSTSYSGNPINEMINYLLVGLVSSGNLKIRVLKSKAKQKYYFRQYVLNIQPEKYNNQFGIIMVIDFFKWLLDCNTIQLVEIFSKSNDKHSIRYGDEAICNFIGQALIILDIDANNLEPKSESNIQDCYKWEFDNKFYYYNLSNAFNSTYHGNFVACHTSLELRIDNYKLKFTSIFVELLRFINKNKIIS